LGAMGQVGCCGPRRTAPTSRRYRPDNTQPSALPLHRPPLPYKDTTPTHSGPPSVLRPEHAWQPYKEESDDETGYIMGAWQPFPRPGYNVVDDKTPTAPDVPTSGFTRVGGGRAHFDTPYAIASGSTQTFPSIERDRDRHEPSSQLAAPPITTEDYSPPLTPSIPGTVSAKMAGYLPPGAMPPVHARTKSQTAIVEHAGTPAPLAYHSHPQSSHMNSGSQDVGEDGVMGQSKKKHWYNLRKGRRLSEPDSSHRQQALSSSSAPSESEPGRSFVVVRKQRPGTGTSQQSDAQGSSDPPGERSFTVVRGNNQDTSS